MLAEAAQNLPFVSILIPVRNESAHIEKVLQAVLGQDYPANLLEVYVMDGHSTDNTKILVADFQQRFANVYLIDNPQRIVPAGMNLALVRARGDIIIRVDGHTIIAPDYVRQCVSAIQDSGADNAGGKMSPVGRTPFGQAVVIATSSPFGIGNARFHYSDQVEWVDTVYLGAWRREVFQRVGLFDEEMVRDQDDEFNYRLRASGGRILLDPRIRSTYTVRSTPRALWKQYFQYGYWKVRVLQKHPRQMSPRQFVPPLFVLALLLGLAGSAFSPPGRGFLALIVGLYLLADLAAALLTSARRGWKHLPRLPLVFAILHLSYGCGFLAGLVRFWNRWGDKRGKVPNLEISGA